MSPWGARLTASAGEQLRLCPCLQFAFCGSYEWSLVKPVFGVKMNIVLAEYEQAFPEIDGEALFRAVLRR